MVNSTLSCPTSIHTFHEMRREWLILNQLVFTLIVILLITNNGKLGHAEFDAYISGRRRCSHSLDVVVTCKQHKKQRGVLASWENVQSTVEFSKLLICIHISHL